MKGTDYLLVVWVLVVLIIMFKNQIDIPQKGGIHLDWTPSKPKGFLLHLPSRVNFLGGNLVRFDYVSAAVIHQWGRKQ